MRLRKIVMRTWIDELVNAYWSIVYVLRDWTLGEKLQNFHLCLEMDIFESFFIESESRIFSSIPNPNPNIFVEYFRIFLSKTDPASESFLSRLESESYLQIFIKLRNSKKAKTHKNKQTTTRLWRYQGQFQCVSRYFHCNQSKRTISRIECV